ncbi:putative sugar O-methyltransferase [Bradyrhizobium sp. LjRoot220]|uniref:putative sugar O-methyltransferase n=1 Tax=Bradyrhizobium sp. LjRoot220 TaxID=3342284 RepID=UPI003ECF2782
MRNPDLLKATEAMQLEDLQQRIGVVREAIERNAELSRQMAAGRTSKFWAEIFGERRIYPDINTLMVSRREGAIAGAGDNPQGSLEREQAYCARVHHIYRLMVDKHFVRSLPESTFGSPLVFEHDGIARSANFWMNAATTARVTDFVKKFGKSGPLKVLEIGPGWGACVYQLHHSIDVESYTLVDLPENLYMSTLHLGTVLPDRPVEFIDVVGEKVTEVPRGKIHACLPGAISRLEAKFDLVVNSYSLQEMDLESVQQYIDWIETVLSPDGIFVSLNSHAKAGVQKPSDYGYEKFHIHHWGVFRLVPSGFFNTIPYEVVAGKRNRQSPDYPVECQDGVGRLMQVGLDKDIAGLAAALVAGNLGAQQIELLGGYNQFFLSRSDDERFRKLQQLKHLDSSPALPFITALLFLARGDRKQAVPLFEEAIASGLQGFARIRAEVFLAGLAGKAGASFRSDAVDGLDPAYAYPDAKHIIETGDLAHAIVHIDRAFGRHRMETASA